MRKKENVIAPSERGKRENPGPEKKKIADFFYNEATTTAAESFIPRGLGGANKKGEAVVRLRKKKSFARNFDGTKGNMQGGTKGKVARWINSTSLRGRRKDIDDGKTEGPLLEGCHVERGRMEVHVEKGKKDR